MAQQAADQDRQLDRDIDEFEQVNSTAPSSPLANQHTLEAELMQTQQDLANINEAMRHGQRLTDYERRHFFREFFRFFRDPRTSKYAFTLSAPGSSSIDEAEEDVGAWDTADLHLHHQRENVVDENECYNDDVPTNLAVFEDTKELIYNGIAAFVAANELRPNFLERIFKLLRMLDTDYLRERALLLLQYLFSSVLPDSRRPAGRFETEVPLSEHTPSDSDWASFDDLLQDTSQDLPAPCTAGYSTQAYDYEELAESDTSLTTPEPEQAFERSIYEYYLATEAPRVSQRAKEEMAWPLFGSDTSKAAAVGSSRLQTEFADEMKSNEHIVLQVAEYLRTQTRDTLMSERVVGDVASLLEQLVEQTQVYAESRPDPGQLTVAVRETLLKHVGKPVSSVIKAALHAIADILYDEMVFNKVVQRVDRSYEQEIEDLETAQAQLANELGTLRQLRREDLDTLQWERWRRLRPSVPAGRHMERPPGPVGDKSRTNGSFGGSRETTDEMEQVPATTDNFSTGAVVQIELTPAECRSATGDESDLEEPTAINPVELSDLPENLTVISEPGSIVGGGGYGSAALDHLESLSCEAQLTPDEIISAPLAEAPSQETAEDSEPCRVGELI